MSKSTILRGDIKLKEITLSENLTNRILSISSDGTLTDRPAIDATGFLTASLPSGQIYVGNSLGAATATSITGDITITNTGITSISSGVIVNADINASAAIAYSKLNLAAGIVNADINSSAAIAYSKLNLTGAILNADINASAAITRSKLANGTAYRILANNAAGVISENAAITASRAVVSDANGQLTASATTSTQIGYLSTLTSDVQTQLATTITGKATNSVVQSPTSGEDGFAIIWDDATQEWTLGDPVVQGIPVGGSTRQFLGKNSGTNYDTDWLALLISDVSDIDASADDINVLLGANSAGITPTKISYLSGVTSDIQTQIGNKLTNSLSQNSLWLGNGSNQAGILVAGSEGYVLTISGGVPTWQAVVGTGTVTSIDVSGGSTGLSFAGGPITTTGTITASGTLIAVNGGTGITSYAVGDILYADTTTTLDKLGVGSNGDILTLSGGLPVWQAAGGIPDGDKGDITVSSSGTVWTIDAAINKAWTGTHSFLDNSWTLLDNSDSTKVLAFQLSGITTGTTRTLTVPDLSGTMAILGASGNGAALTKTDDTNVTLTLGGNPTTALLSAASVTVGWTGQLAVTRGGTGLSSASQGDILYANASNNLTALAKDTSATRYLSNTGTSNNPAWAQINLTNGVTGVLPVANGGTGSATQNFWTLSGTSTLTGATTITSNTASQLTFNGVWTSTASGQSHSIFEGTFTSRATASDVMSAYTFSPTLVATDITQILSAVDVKPTFSGSAADFYTARFMNSSSQKLLSVRNDGYIFIGENVNRPRIYSANNGSTIVVNGTGLVMASEGQLTTTPSLNFNCVSPQNTSGSIDAILMGTPAAGLVITDNQSSRKYIYFSSKITVNTATGFTGTLTGFDWNPTLTSTTGLTSHVAFRATSGSLLIGATNLTSSSTKFQLRGNGSGAGTLILAEDLTPTARFTLLDNGNLSLTKGIDTTSGDSATINAVVGRFRKDTSGSTFTLTNSFITANSIIVLTPANSGLDLTATGWTVNAGSGSATITFNAAPTANFDMNFMVIN
jgi:hypothetical protein